METLSVRCNHCGAPLQVADSTRFVTCQFCQSNLAVKRTDSSVFTEEVAQIAENTGKMAESLEVIALQNEIERLDREHGPELAAKKLGEAQGGAAGCIGVIFMLMFTSFGVFFATSSSKMGAPAIFPIVGGGFALIGLISLGKMLMSALAPEGTETPKSGYEARRAELVRKIADLTKS